MIINRAINSYSDLVTSREETRTGFINFALEKNRRSTPYIESAKVFRRFADRANCPKDLLKIEEIRQPLLTASGLSDKSLNYFTEEDKDKAITELINNFLEPAGNEFVDEVVFRYLLIKGDSLGGSMRNIIGVLAQQKLIRCLLSTMTIKNVSYFWVDGNEGKGWCKEKEDDYEVECTMKAISWKNNTKWRTLGFNLKIPLVNNNVDLCLFDCDYNEYDNGKIVNSPEKAIMFGELKGGIDPAGADEHWKTGNSALDRIRMAFNSIKQPIMTSFIGAAIENKMASEIYNQLSGGTLTNAANLTKDNQLIEYCDWLLTL